MVLSHFRDRKVVVLDFWAIWCMPCLMAMPDLQQLHDEIGGRVEVVAVNLGEDPDKVRRFVDRKGYTFTVVEDPDQEVGGTLRGERHSHGGGRGDRRPRQVHRGRLPPGEDGRTAGNCWSS